MNFLSLVFYVIIIKLISLFLNLDYLLIVNGFKSISQLSVEQPAIAISILLIHATLPVLLALHFYLDE